MSATPTINGVPETFTLKVSETHLDKAIAAFKASAVKDHPVGHAPWCVMAQAGKVIHPDATSGCSSLGIPTASYVPVDSFGGILYRNITEAFDRADFDHLRTMLPVEIPMKRRHPRD